MEAINTAQVALEFTTTEELATANAVVAWAGAAMDLVLGWTGNTPVARPAAIKTLRERFGYHLDSNGQPKLDAKGNRMKRSAIFDRIATVDALLDHIVKRDKAWIATFQEAVQSGNLAAYDAAIKSLASSIVASAGGRGLKEIRFWLDNQKPMPKEKPVDAAAALGGNTDADAPAQTPSPDAPDALLRMIAEISAVGQLQRIVAAANARLAQIVKDTDEAAA